MKNLAIGVDIGGSHISCCLVDISQKKIFSESLVTLEINNRAAANEIISAWAKAIHQLCEKINCNQLAGVGFAMPGPFDYASGIAKFTHEVDKYHALFDVDVAESLSKLLPFDKSQFRFMNDASAFAVGEALLGKAKDVLHSISLTLGTGFGSAFIENYLPVIDRLDVPKLGCLWHLPFKDGIGDDYFSTRWFVKRYHELTGLQIDGVKELVTLAQERKEIQEIFNEFGNNLSVFLSEWINKFNAEKLVLGGNITGAYSLFGSALEKGFKNRGVVIQTGISELKENAALVGAACMFVEDYWLKLQPLLPKM